MNSSNRQEPVTMLPLVPLDNVSLDPLPDEKDEKKPKRSLRGKLKSVVTIAGRTVTIKMDALDTFFYLMAERHRIYRKRTAGLPFPWTDDPILIYHRFCNVYRLLDRGTQYVLDEVINKGPQDYRETCFRVMLYKLFNRIPTWEYIVQKLGTPAWETFDMARYGRVLRARLLSSPIYTGVYQIPAPKLGYSTSYMNHLRQLQMMMEDDVPGLLLEKRSLKEAFGLIESYPGMGPFLGLQLLLDLNLTERLNFSESEWVTCGPGSRSYLRQIFGDDVSGIHNEAIAYLYNTQNDHFERLGITDPPSLSPDRPGVSYVDIEHSLCECHKYVKLKKQFGTGQKTKKEEFKPNVGGEKKVRVKTETKFRVKDEDTKKPKVKIDEMETESKSKIKTQVKAEIKDEKDVIDMLLFPQREVIVVSDSEDTPEREVIVISDSENEDSPEIIALPNPVFNKGNGIIDVDAYDDAADPGRYVEDDIDYEVSHVVADRRTPKGKWEYKVRWTGYGPEDDMWLPEEELRNASLILREWRVLRRSRLRKNDVVKAETSKSMKSRIMKFSI